MNCQDYDWKSYALGELDRSVRNDAEAHAKSCPACREELAALRMTLGALGTLREEEIPRRIAFVSDQIFEPHWYQRAFRLLWTPNFAAACVLAGAILFHAFHTPAVDQAAVDSQINAAVSKAVSVIEARQELEKARADEMYFTTARFQRP